ncbi:CapA family protein [Nocardioides sp. NPDC127503]|uniref:CapA family protein n=1 Tax=Nocardioides sp. NPDC127503 TaxID=3154516 RepID=UPI00332FB24A
MTVRIAAVGDIVLQQPETEKLFEPSSAILRAADVAIGQIEVPHTTSTETTGITVPSPPAEPEALRAMAEAGFTVGTTAGNHAFDLGTKGVVDTIEAAAAYGIATTGTGANVAAAVTPVVTSVRGRTVGVLSYNCVGPRESWATSLKAGAAYVKVITHYELDDANPGNPPTVYTFCDKTSLRAMTDQVAALAERVDIVVVALHKGIGHTPAVIADYEFEVARAAVDAGADMVVGHHAHIMRGVEVYRGAPIFHGLGNFVTVTDALTPDADNDSEELRAWAKRRRELYGFEPDPTMPAYPFHPESRNTAIAVIDVDDDNRVRPALIPCWIDEQARPTPLAQGEGDSVVAYIEGISRTAGLTTSFRWADGGTAVVVS